MNEFSLLTVDGATCNIQFWVMLKAVMVVATSVWRLAQRQVSLLSV